MENLPNIYVRSASLWGCELKYVGYICRCLINRSASLWGCELKSLSDSKKIVLNPSASLWGCELKCVRTLFFANSYMVSLLVRLWVEILNCNAFIYAPFVSLLVRLWVEIYKEENHGKKKESQPPCEAVSWNIKCSNHRLVVRRQPPCEAVSWNDNSAVISKLDGVSLLVRLWVEIRCWRKSDIEIRSASLWGCELK